MKADIVTYISSPTVRKGQFFSGNKILQKAKAASRKATGIHNRADRAIPNLKRCRRGVGSFVNSIGKSPKRLWKLDASDPSKRKQSRHGCEIKSKSQSLKPSNEAQEPCAVKVARTVPRGGKRRKASTYPDL
jgi:hypothetical protein